MATEALEIRLARLEEQIAYRLASLDETVRGLVGRIDSQGARIDALGESLGGRIDSLAGRTDSLDGRIQSLSGRIDTVVFWVAGFIVTSLAGLATSLVLLLLRP